ncbi:MAG: hypothetical protein EAZ89_18105 [Bacteroidetes bacterium]|nr:MAG: hypothetical protein EAZ89_18105 [Bacteroidota bacterium]
MHSGIDPQSFATIILELLRSGNVRGGSTITMQLARNLYSEVGKERTLVRKLKEYLVSAYIERKFTKQEIMEGYLNTVNIFGNSYGIETTSSRLFNKHAKDLNIEEAAMVVGMLKGQGVYNPIKHPQRTQDRRNIILSQMAIHGFIDASRVNIDSIKAIPIGKSIVKQEDTHIEGPAPYFREYVRQQMEEWCEKNGYNLYRDGLRIYTTLDSRLQAHAEKAVTRHMQELQKDFDKMEGKGAHFFNEDPTLMLDLRRQTERYRLAQKAGKKQAEIDAEFRTKVPMEVFSWSGPIDTVMTPEDSIRYYARFLETGLVSIDPGSGQVKAWVGGIDFRYFKYDHVATGKRQVGSTFKPFVYGAAVQNGYAPCDRFLNQPVVFEAESGGERWVPKNSDGSIGGMMTLRSALANSVNLVTAQIMKELTPHTVAEFARNMGIHSQMDEVPALCLGTPDLSVLELTQAYSTFANMGVRIEPQLVTRIEDRNGKLLVSFPTESREVLSPEKAAQIIDMLQAVVDQGTAHRLRYRYNLKNEIAGKTGTTQNQSDGWFVGFTPNLCTGVWVGCSDRRIRFRSIAYGQGANMALPSWAYYMQSAYADDKLGFDAPPFIKPQSVSTACDPVQTSPDTPSDGADPDYFEGT